MRQAGEQPLTLSSRRSIASTQYKTFWLQQLHCLFGCSATYFQANYLRLCLSTSSGVFSGLLLAGANLQDIARAADAGVRSCSFHNSIQLLLLSPLLDSTSWMICISKNIKELYIYHICGVADCASMCL